MIQLKFHIVYAKILVEPMFNGAQGSLREWKTF